MYNCSRFPLFNSEVTLSPSDNIAAPIAATLSSSAVLGSTDAIANPSTLTKTAPSAPESLINSSSSSAYLTAMIVSSYVILMY